MKVYFCPIIDDRGILLRIHIIKLFQAIRSYLSQLVHKIWQETLNTISTVLKEYKGKPTLIVNHVSVFNSNPITLYSLY